MKIIAHYVGIAALLGSLAGCSPKVETQPIDTTPTKIATKIATKTTPRLDTREILPLNPMQREHVLIEMRGLLGATQSMLEGLANNDMSAVQEAASSVGMNAMHTIENQENMKRLKMGQSVPPKFMTLGQGVHKAFDDMAQMAEDGKPGKDIQLKLVNTMNACVACHSAYQIPNP